jgi:competence protein ComEA
MAVGVAGHNGDELADFSFGHGVTGIRGSADVGAIRFPLVTDDAKTIGIGQGVGCGQGLALRGPTADADLAAVNLAAPLSDGLQINIPSFDATAGATATVAGDKVNLNTASRAELEALPGLGPVTAERLIEYRSAYGPFTSLEQVLELKLINRGQLEQIRDLVVVE